ncbi:hypothetical protein SK128_006082 [Halocaridina rubra]|uniref:Uncharacterized protein n=1 Tax=Halocaridina rubra TaxID=373956 RepID=A0AAN8XBH4_HALRR
MLKTIRSYIRKYLKSNSGVRRRSVVEDELQERQDELEVLALSFETLASCLQRTQRCPFKIKILRQSKNSYLKELITETMTVPSIPSAQKLMCDRWLTDFRELASDAWENLPESEAFTPSLIHVDREIKTVQLLCRCPTTNENIELVLENQFSSCHG